MWLFQPLLPGAAQQLAAPPTIDARVSWVQLEIPGVAGGGGSTLKYWTGAAWVEKPLKRWNGASWVDTTLKRWDGGAWITA